MGDRPSICDEDIQKYIMEFYKKHGVFPSHTQIGFHLKISRRQVSYTLKKLHEQGVLERTPQPIPFKLPEPKTIYDGITSFADYLERDKEKK